MKMAFDILKVWKNERWGINHERWNRLIKAVIPNRSEAQISLLWQVLDDDGDNFIGKCYRENDFTCMSDFLNDLIEPYFLGLYFTHVRHTFISLPNILKFHFS